VAVVAAAVVILQWQVSFSHFGNFENITCES
jgi:hypothetical protein